MIKLHRLELSANTSRTLAKRQRTRKPDQESLKKVKADHEILQRLAFSSGGVCHYCERDTLSEVDHFYPKSLYPDQRFSWTNFVGSCSICNKKKGTKFPEDQKGALFLNPFEDDPLEFFHFSPTSGKLVPQSNLSLKR